MEQPPLQEQVQLDSPPPAQQSQPTKPSIIPRAIIGAFAVVLAASFFMPWATFLGEKLSGLEIQKNLDSYKLVWLMPACAAITLILAVFGAPTGIARRATGAIPFAILAYSLNKFGSDLFRILAPGAWVALVAGIVLIVTPSAFNCQSKA